MARTPLDPYLGAIDGKLTADVKIDDATQIVTLSITAPRDLLRRVLDTWTWSGGTVTIASGRFEEVLTFPPIKDMTIEKP